ncbi:MAG: M23 family metallopeptidase [Bacteroidaceae bacterium]|jgi:Membrane-bound metallopeptidase|nr:M23 family metallopeptidase [Bacteroidaceae bacterium]
MEENKSNKPHRHVWLPILCGIGGVVLGIALLCFTPLRALQPGYLTPQSREQVLNFALRVDSLEEAVARQNLYVTNLQDILRGRVKVDTVISIDTLTALRAADLMEQTEREKEFARQYEANEKYNLITLASRAAGVSGLNLMVPVRGVVQRTFDPQHDDYGIEVLPTVRSSVAAVLDGTVVQSGYTAVNGYSVVIQHNGDLVSVYSHLGTIVCKPGQKVRGGEAIAAVAKVADDQHQNTIHFELWHKGTALDPTLYIAF